MARLPGIALRPQEGARVSAASVEPTDLGLQDAARSLQPFAEAAARKNAEAVRPMLDELATSYGRNFAAEAAREDGTKLGFAKRQLDLYDLHAGETIARAGLSGGQAEALRRGIERQRLAWGKQAVEEEVRKAGDLVADQERARRNGVVSIAKSNYLKGVAPEDQALDDGFDGTSPSYVADKQALHDRVAAQVLEATPEADRPAVKIALDNAALDRLTAAQENARKLHEGVVVRQAIEAADTAASAVVSNPGAALSALKDLPGLLADLPAAARDKALEQKRAQIVTARMQGLKAKGQPALAIAELDGGTWDRMLPPNVKAALLEDMRSDAGHRARDALEAMQYGAEVDPAAADANAAASGDEGLTAQLKYRREVGWAESGALGDGFAGGKAGFSAAVDFTIAREIGPGGVENVRNDNGKGLSRFGINQAANPDIDVSKLTREGAVARYRKYWNQVGADRLPPDMALAAFDAAVLFGPDDANRWTAQSGGDVPRFLALEQAEMRRLAKADPAKYGDDLKGWLNRVEKVRAEAIRTTAFVNTREGLTSDPIKFAAKSPALRAQILALSGEPGQAGWAQALASRQRVGDQISQRYRVPARMLTDAEAAFYKDRIAADPKFALTLAQGGLSAVGPKATRQLLAEVGQQGEAGVHLHLADLSTRGLAGFAQRAETGLALKAKGASLEKDDKDALDKALEARKGVFAGMEDLRLIARQTAEAAMLADVQAGTPQPAASYVQGALGGATRGGRLFGGVAELNGRATVLPHWLAQDHADEALEFLASGFEANAKAARPQGPAATGLKVRGNLDPWNRPILKNPDGSYSTTSSISVGTEQGETLIPTVVAGKRLTSAQAIEHFRKTGEHLGVFDTAAHADAYAVALHNAQAGYVTAKGSAWPVWANGNPLSARDFSRQSLVLAPNGRYRLVNGAGQVFTSSAGGAFEMDLDAAQSALHSRFGPKAVLAP